jgi:AcrR family transcriptional regulator
LATEPATSLREQQADLTRELILRALVELLQEGDADDISVQDVARKAGVSLRTVYRYFQTREELVVAGANWIFGPLFADVRAEETIEDLPESCRIVFRHWDDHPELAEALALTRAGREVRRQRRKQRFEEIERIVAEAAPELSKRDQHEAAAVLGHLQGVTTWLTLRDIGLDNEEATEAVEWALRALTDDIRRRNKAARQPQRRKQ